MNKEKVSIYIPAYNAEKTIKDCIESVVNQTKKFDEIIVIDDKSTDNTLKILEEFSNINIIKNNTNMGLGYNRNLGIKISSNNIVASIDADVVLNTRWLEIMINNISKNHNTMFGGKMTEKLIENKFNAWRAKYYSQNWGNKLVSNPPFLFGCNTILIKSLWKRVNGYDEKFKTNGEDINFIQKIKSETDSQIIYQPEAKCFHLQDDNIESLSKRVWRYHSFGYKIKEPSFKKFIKLSIKQTRFFLQRLFRSLIEFDLSGITISFKVFVNFIKLEYILLSKKK